MSELYTQAHVDTLLGEIARLELRVRSLEQDRAKARVDAFTNAARIAEEYSNDRAWSRPTAAAIAARLRARAAVGQERT